MMTIISSGQRHNQYFRKRNEHFYQHLFCEITYSILIMYANAIKYLCINTHKVCSIAEMIKINNLFKSCQTSFIFAGLLVGFFFC